MDSATFPPASSATFSPNFLRTLFITPLKVVSVAAPAAIRACLIFSFESLGSNDSNSAIYAVVVNLTSSGENDPSVIWFSFLSLERRWSIRNGFSISIPILSLSFRKIGLWTILRSSSSSSAVEVWRSFYSYSRFLALVRVTFSWVTRS